jgi:hypothetical protein
MLTQSCVLGECFQHPPCLLSLLIQELSTHPHQVERHRRQWEVHSMARVRQPRLEHAISGEWRPPTWQKLVSILSEQRHFNPASHFHCIARDATETVGAAVGPAPP